MPFLIGDSTTAMSRANGGGMMGLGGRFACTTGKTDTTKAGVFGLFMPFMPIAESCSVSKVDLHIGSSANKSSMISSTPSPINSIDNPSPSHFAVILYDRVTVFANKHHCLSVYSPCNLLISSYYPRIIHA